MGNSPFVIIGGGLAGLSTAIELGNNSVILEKEKEFGGLVRTSQFNGYWYDHVLHLLYFSSETTEKRIKYLLGDILKPVTSGAWVESLSGTTRFPMQMNLNSLPVNVITSCIKDLAKTSFGRNREPANFEEWLLHTFGKSFCDEFFFPYNRKMWSRDLSKLMPTNFKWNITRPDFDLVLSGALNKGSEFKAYNSNGWYPVPDKNSKLRGMACLSNALANEVVNLKYSHIVERIDSENKIIYTKHNNKQYTFEYTRSCIATLPLPLLVELCSPFPDELRSKAKKLAWNNVRSIAINIEGPRPDNMGLWRYFADESIIFTRLVFMHEFDPLSSPEDGWGLLVEITERSETPLVEQQIIDDVLNDIQRLNIISPECRIIEVNTMTAEPAYVVFSSETESIVSDIRLYLESINIYTVGRYARWEYSSMSQVMTDGFQLGQELKQQLAYDHIQNV